MEKLKIYILFVFYVFLLSAFNSHGQFGKTETIIDSFSVHFEVGKFTTKNTNDLIAKLKNLPRENKYSFLLYGFTDSVGSVQSNILLASKRLNYVSGIILKENTTFVIDTFNVNEKMNKILLKNDYFRRVDIKIFEIKYNLELNKPLVLGINFQPGSTDMMPGSRVILENLRDILENDKDINIELSGHICCLNDTQNLSMNRALKVKRFLTENGISGDRIICFGFGNKKPKLKEVDEKTKAINRRVEIVFLKLPK